MSGCHMAAEGVLAARSLIWAATQLAHSAGAQSEGPLTIASWPEPPSIEDAVLTFVPTALCLSRGSWGPHANVSIDVDSNTDSRFYSAIWVSDRYGERGAQRQIARAYLAPPAKPGEIGRRAELLAHCGKGVPIDEDRREAFPLTGRLSADERAKVGLEPPHEQAALVAVLASRCGQALVISPRGAWPRSELVRAVAERLGCRIVRVSLKGVPPIARRSLRNIRYG